MSTTSTDLPYRPVGASLEEEAPVLFAYSAEFKDVDAVMSAARKCRDFGFTRWDVHAPCPIHGMDEAMGIKPTILPWLVLGGGLFGTCGGLLMQWWMNAFDYQFLISGKPLWSLPANIPVAFETTVMGAAYTAVFSMFMLNRLPRLYNPLFKSARFRKATDDRFFVVIEASDPKFDENKTREFLERLHPESLERVED